jgi:HEPN domain-containing protein
VLISLGSLPPSSHALERLVDSLEAGGVDVTPIRTVRLKALSRMNTETRYPSDSEAPADRFDAEDSALARTAAAQVMAFAQAAITQ